MGEDGYCKFKEHYTQQAFEKCFFDCMKYIDNSGGKLTLCIYQGKMFGKEKSGLLQKADVFVFPTYYDNECFPVVLLEAMQHKLPVVTTNEGEYQIS